MGLNKQVPLFTPLTGFFNINFYLFLAVLGLHCCVGFSLVVASGGYSLVAVHGLRIAVASVVWHIGLAAPWHVNSSPSRD